MYPSEHYTYNNYRSIRNRRVRAAEGKETSIKPIGNQVKRCLTVTKHQTF